MMHGLDRGNPLFHTPCMGPISGVRDVLWQSMESHLAPVACVHIRGVSAIQEAGLEGY